MSELRIRARKLLDFTTEQLWANLAGEFTLVFDDGEIKTNHMETLYSSYAWEFHRMFPKTKMLVKHHVRHVIGKGQIGSKTHLVLLGNACWSVHDAYRNDTYPDRDKLAELVYQFTNTMYNELSYRSESYVVSIDILDFVGVITHPTVHAALEAVESTRESVNKTLKIISGVLDSDTDLPNNALVRVGKSNLVNRSQVLQCVGPRGVVTDVNSDEFTTLIMRGFGQGLRLLHDVMVESRSAAKSLFFSKSPLEQAEYFSRRLQLLCQTVRNLHHGDCQSGKYLAVKIRPAQYYMKEKIADCDLDHWEGKYYLDEMTGQLKAIRRDDYHLVDRTLKIRSVIAGCAHPDPYGMCSTCFGELAYSVPPKTNIGHMCATSMTQKSSQSVLSVKHNDSGGSSDDVILSQEEQRYLKVPHKSNSYFLSETLKGRKIQLYFAATDVASLSDIDTLDDISKLNVSRISEIDYIGFRIDDQNEILPIKVSQARRKASMTYAFLEFVKKRRWDNDPETNAYIVDVSGWDFSKEILVLPLKHFNMSDHSGEIADMIEGSVTRMKERDHAQNPEAVLVEFCDLVNSKLNVNIAVLEVILYAATVVSVQDNDFTLPKAWTTSELGVSKKTIEGRSESAMMAYEGQRKVILNPASFFSSNRMSHPMDVFLRPREVIETMYPGQ